MTEQVSMNSSKFGVMRSTNFGSKGMYKETSTVGGRTSLSNWVDHI